MLEGLEGVSTFAEEIDNAFIIVSGITLFLFVITIGSMLYFIYKYSASKNPKEDTKNIKHYTPIEIAWTVIPTALMMVVFYYGFSELGDFKKLKEASDAQEKKIVEMEKKMKGMESIIKSLELIIKSDVSKNTLKSKKIEPIKKEPIKKDLKKKESKK